MFVSLGRNLKGVVHDVLMKEVETEEDAFREIRLLLAADGPIATTTVNILTYDDSCPVFKNVCVGVTKDGTTKDGLSFIIRKSSSPMYSTMPEDASLCKLRALEVALYTKYMENLSQNTAGDIGFVSELR